MPQHSLLIQECCHEIDVITKLVTETYSKMASEKLFQKGKEGSWSIAENLKHIILVNTSYFPVMDRLLESTEPVRYHWFKKYIAKFVGPWLLKKVSRHRKEKIKTFSIWQPEQLNPAQDIIHIFKEHQELVKMYLMKSSPLLASGCIISSPANNAVSYRLEDAFRILIEHEWRHLQQIHETQSFN
ncbi:MAG: DinB family protein [Saprospiraceae bacterium]|nr:DinB family protein [Saprospiraceae bacterium]